MRLFTALCIALLIVVPGSWQPVSAGTTTIQVDTETGGNIDVNGDGIYENVNGALFWNGTEWSVNDTYGHMYFTNLDTGEKLKDFNSVTVNYNGGGNNIQLLLISGSSTTVYQVLHNEHTYEKNYNGTTYRIRAAEFIIRLLDSITLSPIGPRVVLVSRSADLTGSSPFFDVYIGNEDGSTEAFRSDPVWFHYDTDIDAALGYTDPVSGKKGDLVSIDSQYWLDMDGGSEMGGVTFKLITGNFSSPELSGFDSSFITAYAHQYEDADLNLREILVYPHVYSVDAIDPIPTLNEWGVIILGLVMAGATVVRLRQRRSVP